MFTWIDHIQPKLHVRFCCLAASFPFHSDEKFPPKCSYHHKSRYQCIFLFTLRCLPHQIMTSGIPVLIYLILKNSEKSCQSGCANWCIHQWYYKYPFPYVSLPLHVIKLFEFYQSPCVLWHSLVINSANHLLSVWHEWSVHILYLFLFFPQLHWLSLSQ